HQDVLPLLKDGVTPVITGYVASTADGVTTTLGRGGSDYSAAVLAAALNADVLLIYTDVNGVMSADPRIVRGAKSLDRVSYAEAAELSYFGAKVIHPRTVLPAIEAHIPVRILNTFAPEHPGTTITGDPPVAMVAAVGEGMRGTPGVAARVFGALGRAGVNVMAIAQGSSELNISFVVIESERDKAVRAVHEEFHRS